MVRCAVEAERNLKHLFIYLICGRGEFSSEFLKCMITVKKNSEILISYVPF